jgi:hypothetical protein
VAAHLFDDCQETAANLVQKDDAVTRPHPQDCGDVFGLSTGYRHRALGAEDLINEKTTLKEVPKVSKVS